MPDSVYIAVDLHPDPELHLTLAYLGQADEDTLTALAEALRRNPAAELAALAIHGTGGAFTPEGRVVWWSVAPTDALLACRDHTVAEAEKLGFRIRALFSPHITVGSDPDLWDLHDIPKPANLTLDPLTARARKLHITHTGIHPASLFEILRFAQ